MYRDELPDFMAMQWRTVVELAQRKGSDYAGDEDVLNNFREVSSELGLSVEQVWAVWTHKHWSAIMTYCRTGQVVSEGIEGRLHDLIVYALLMLLIIRERKRSMLLDPVTEEMHVPEEE